MKRVIILAVLAIATFTGCTENQSAKNYGGKMTIDLPPRQKLVNVTWKETELWYLTRPAKAGEVPETLTFTEKSNYGILEGTIIFNEH
jgi:hypothetical protein